MGKYVPGAQIRAFVETIRPSIASQLAFERGFYEGNYTVVSVPEIPLRPGLEKIRQAAYAKWPQTVVSLEDIMDWVREGAPDVLIGGFDTRTSSLTPENAAVRFINSGVFERQ